MKNSHLFKKILVLIAFGILVCPLAFSQTVRTRPAAEHLIIKCRLIIDPGPGRTMPDAFIEITNGRIMRVGPIAQIPEPTDAKILDFSDKIIIPGLIDTHTHLFGGIVQMRNTYELPAYLFLSCGVTTIRTPGAMNPGGDLALRDRINAGCYEGPRIYISGAYLDMDPPVVGWMNPIRTAEEARLTIDHWAEKGATSIKLYASFKGDIMKAAIDHAHLHGLRAITHIGATTYEEAIKAGFDEIFHGALVLSDILPKDLNQKNYKEWYKAIETMDMSRPEVGKILKMAADARVVLTPTVAVTDKMDFQGEFILAQKKYYTEAAWDKAIKQAEKPFVEGEEKITEQNLRFVKAAYQAGCILTTGTDKTNIVPLPGFSLWHEMSAFARAGLPAMAILKAATWNGAYALAIDNILGSLEPGKLADFVILDKNPLEDIHNVRSVHRVVKGGVVYDPEKLLIRVAGRIE